MKLENCLKPARLFCILLLAGCSILQEKSRTYWPTQQWQVATPESQGMDSAELFSALYQIQEDSLPIHSLLIIRNGYLVHESYFYPYTGKTLHSWASVSKSIMTTLVGIAIDKGFIQDVNQSVNVFFPEYSDFFSRRQQDLKIKDLLTMSTGFDCGYRQGELELLAMERSQDHIAEIFKLAQIKAPGEEFSYCSGAMHLLSAIVSRATKQSAFEFAKQMLFQPLAITQVQWPADPQGITHGWSHIRMHPRDMAKIGFLYLNNGYWDGRQIISSAWIEDATRVHIDTPDPEVGYGYGWWVRQKQFAGIYEALGRGGQSMSVFPAQDLVVVINGAGFDRGSIAELLLGAIKSTTALPENPVALGKLQQKAVALLEPPPFKEAPALPALARKISGKRIAVAPNLLGIEAITLNFSTKDLATLDLSAMNLIIQADIGFNGRFKISEIPQSKIKQAAYGRWLDENRLSIHYTEANGFASYQLLLTFRGNQVDIQLEDKTGHFTPQHLVGAWSRSARSEKNHEKNR